MLDARGWMDAARCRGWMPLMLVDAPDSLLFCCCCCCPGACSIDAAASCYCCRCFSPLVFCHVFFVTVASCWLFVVTLLLFVLFIIAFAIPCH
jgi:hypothetical protein